ncbi:hypothetical protein LAh9_110 [Aeromonas phage LAh_9]|uniref:Uncharacterized protein n=1 Tax=Aeromonas phage LAh_9 TaxID=2591033 RepID=A0A514A145_9CAUD|nr:hypothetical protein HWC32_gp111 [Aeromonas phage LAh_9]QDH46997.1 hypothetical protein LAh9_110 [Aeromonas phage LAh_9]
MPLYRFFYVKRSCNNFTSRSTISNCYRSSFSKRISMVVWCYDEFYVLMRR